MATIDDVIDDIDILSDDDTFSIDEDTKTLVTKFENFEFTDNLGVMRVVRMIITLQILGLIIDNPSIQIPLLFRVFCRGPLFYAIHFYSRPFIDAVYLVQLFFAQIASDIQSSVPSKSSAGKIVVTARRLFGTTYKSYTDEPTIKQQYGFQVNFIDDRNWHAIKHFSHFFLGIFLVIMATLFTLRFWEIRDYTDREEIRLWLRKYVGDGWWRRGGLGVAVSTARGLVYIGVLFLLLFVVSRQFNPRTALPEPRMIGGVAITGLSVILIIYILGYVCIRSTEAIFVRYVSQNVAYSSGLILKKVIKSKTEIGLSLMLLLFMPVCYNLVQSVFCKY
jgi:hypothetical protein